jgi:hypothetical protein
MSCGDSSTGAEVPERSLETLRLASLSLRVDEATLDVSAEAWRSYQPSAGKEEHPLLTLVRVRSTGAPLPPTLALDGIYLIHDEEVHAAAGREEEARAPGARFAEFMVRGGPNWAPGDSIDVVVALRTSSATTLLLRAPRVAIARVD